MITSLYDLTGRFITDDRHLAARCIHVATDEHCNVVVFGIRKTGRFARYDITDVRVLDPKDEDDLRALRKSGWQISDIESKVKPAMAFHVMQPMDTAQPQPLSSIQESTLQESRSPEDTPRGRSRAPLQESIEDYREPTPLKPSFKVFPGKCAEDGDEPGIYESKSPEETLPARPRTPATTEQEDYPEEQSPCRDRGDKLSAVSKTKL